MIAESFRSRFDNGDQSVFDPEEISGVAQRASATQRKKERKNKPGCPMTRDMRTLKPA